MSKIETLSEFTDKYEPLLSSVVSTVSKVLNKLVVTLHNGRLVKVDMDNAGPFSPRYLETSDEGVVYAENEGRWAVVNFCVSQSRFGDGDGNYEKVEFELHRVS